MMMLTMTGEGAAQGDGDKLKAPPFATKTGRKNHEGASRSPPGLIRLKICILRGDDDKDVCISINLTNITTPERDQRSLFQIHENALLYFSLINIEKCRVACSQEFLRRNFKWKPHNSIISILKVLISRETKRSSLQSKLDHLSTIKYVVKAT